jgi:hypothetical protein
MLDCNLTVISVVRSESGSNKITPRGKLFVICLPCDSPLRHTEHDLQNRPVFFAIRQRGEGEMGFVDFLYILQKRDESGEFFEARAAGVNVRHGSVQDDRIDLRLECAPNGAAFGSM